jgi:hypothetical protein
MIVDYTELIRRLGGHETVAKDLGYPEVKPRQVYQWGLRNSVPALYVLPMFNLARARGLAATPDDLPTIDPFAEATQ